MSASTNVFTDLDDLLVSIDKLLQTATAHQVPTLAERLGAEAQLDAALDLVVDFLTQLANAVDRLRKPLRKADGVVAGFEVIADSMNDFADGRYLRELGDFLGLRNAPFQPLADGVQQSAAYLKAALALSDLLPSPAELSTAGTRLHGIGTKLGELKAAAPSTSPHPLTQSTIGGTQP